MESVLERRRHVLSLSFPFALSPRSPQIEWRGRLITRDYLGSTVLAFVIGAGTMSLSPSPQ